MNPHLQLSDYYLQSARNYIPESRVIHKFGEAQALPTGVFSNIWDGASTEIDPSIPVYTYSTTAAIDTISSTNALDTGQSIEIQGLDTNLDFVIQTITTAGQVKVPLSIPLLRAFGMKNLSPFGDDILGNLYLYEDTAAIAGLPTDSTKVRAIIRDGHNQTQMSMFSVPRGYTLYITFGWSNISKAGGATAVEVEAKIRQRGIGLVWRDSHKTVLLSSGSSSSSRPYRTPIPFVGGEEIEYLGQPSTGGLSVAAGFHGILIREDYINSKAPIVVP